MAEPFRVLLVCTGNVCRSPAAQLLLTEALGRPTDVRVTSAGIGALDGHPVDDPVAGLLRADGVDPSAFRARHLELGDVRAAGLVLGVTRLHRSRAVALWPANVRSAYTLKEFARLAGRVQLEDAASAAFPPTTRGRLEAVATLAHRYRRPGPPSEDDIEDPFGREREVHARVYREIKDAVAAIARVTSPV